MMILETSSEDMFSENLCKNLRFELFCYLMTNNRLS